MRTGIVTPISQVAERMSRIDAAMRSRMWFTVDATKRWARSRIAQIPVPAQGSRLSCWLAGHLTDEWLVALLATLLSIGAYAWYARNGLTLAYSDALSRMMIARRVLVSRTPGLAQFGTTWLPFHFFLMLPLIWNDALFHSGLAGSVPSMVAYVVASVYMFRLGRLLFAWRGAGWVAAVALMFNPSLMYIQSTALSEAPLLCTTVLTTYYALTWARSYQASDLVKSAAAVAAGTGIRYDAWMTAGAVAVIVAYLAWRRQGYKAAEAWTILYSLLGFAGCAAWLVYNGIIFHDPLLGFFYGVASHSQPTGATQTPGNHRPWLSFEMYGYPVVDTVLKPIAFMGVLGLIIFAFRFRLRAITLPAYILLVPYAFYWLAFYTGWNQINVPELGMGYWNNRFALQMLPAAVLFLTCLVTLAVQRRQFLIRLVLLSALVGLIVGFGVVNSSLTTPYLLREPLPTESSVASLRVTTPEAARWFTSHYHGGNVLISYVPHANFMFYMFRAIPDRAFITDANGPQYRAALAHPETSVAWIVLQNQDEANLVWAGLRENRDWRRYFVLRKTFDGMEFYERIGDSRAGDARAGTSMRAQTLGPPPVPLSSYASVQASTSHAELDTAGELETALPLRLNANLSTGPDFAVLASATRRQI